MSAHTSLSSSDAAAARLADAPVVRVLHGNPTPEETAAVVAVVAASAAAAAAASADNEVGVRMRPDGPLIVSYWNSPSRMMRRRFTLRNRPGPRAWVFSARS